MGLINKIFFYIGLVILLLYIAFFLIMLIPMINLYWLVLIICLLVINSLYKKSNSNLTKRIIIYIIILSTVYMMYGTNLACYAKYSIPILPNILCLDFDVVIEYPLYGFDFYFKYLILIGLIFIELSFIGNMNLIDRVHAKK